MLHWAWYWYQCFLAELSPEESEDVLFKEVLHFFQDPAFASHIFLSWHLFTNKMDPFCATSVRIYNKHFELTKWTLKEDMLFPLQFLSLFLSLSWYRKNLNLLNIQLTGMAYILLEKSQSSWYRGGHCQRKTPVLD